MEILCCDTYRHWSKLLHPLNNWRIFECWGIPIVLKISYPIHWYRYKVSKFHHASVLNTSSLSYHSLNRKTLNSLNWVDYTSEEINLRLADTIATRPSNCHCKVFVVLCVSCSKIVLSHDTFSQWSDIMAPHKSAVVPVVTNRVTNKKTTGGGAIQHVRFGISDCVCILCRE